MADRVKWFVWRGAQNECSIIHYNLRMYRNGGYSFRGALPILNHDSHIKPFQLRVPSESQRSLIVRQFLKGMFVGAVIVGYLVGLVWAVIKCI
jgi:hypothetical protein